jgi:YidC/Oxa1 family membrane protein insertase
LRPRFITNARLLCFVSVFPSAIGLRQEGFLWANDLSSYDSIYELPFHIPFYGNHISLFRFWHRLQFLYMKMTTGDQQMAQPQQEGMPDMAKMMKIMIYVSVNDAVFLIAMRLG